MEPAQYETLARIEDRHWFFRGQWSIARRLIAAQLPTNRPLQILDAGCGTGGTTSRLSTFGTVFGVDASADALTRAARRDLRLGRASIDALPFADQTFDLVTSFDVLYHRQVRDDVRALAELYRVLKPGGLLFIRVPALSWLAGAHDVAVHTRHRYTRKELLDKLSAAGFVPSQASYANLLLLPFVFGKRALDALLAPSSDLDLPPAALNRLLAAVLSLESRIIPQVRLPLGVSVVATARRP
jgi:SAM-dependent methyltransferase